MAIHVWTEPTVYMVKLEILGNGRTLDSDLFHRKVLRLPMFDVFVHKNPPFCKHNYLFP